MADDIIQRIVIEGGDEAKKVFTEIASGAAQAFGQLEGALGQATAAFVGLGAAAVAIGGALVAGLFKLTESASQSADALQRLSAVTGVSIQNLSALTTAASAFGISADSMTRAMERFSTQVATNIPKVRQELASVGDSVASADLKVREAREALDKVTGHASLANEKDIALKKARIAVSEAERAADQAHANDIRDFVKYFDDLAKGVERSTSGMNLSMENLRKGIVGSLGGASGIEIPFHELDGSLRKVADPDVQAQLLKLADIFHNMPDGIQKTALAAQLFGRNAGPDMIRFLNQGSAAIKAEEERVKSLGLVLTHTESEELENFRRAQTKLGDELDVVKEKFGAAVSPAYTAFYQTATKFLEDHIADIIHFGEVTNTVLGKLGDAWKAVLPAMGLVGTAFTVVTDAGAAGLDKAVKGVEALTDALASKLKVAVDGLQQYLITPLISDLGRLGTVFEQYLVTPLISDLTRIGTAIYDGFVNAFNSILPPIQSVINTIAGWMQGLIDKATALWSAIKGAGSAGIASGADLGGIPMAEGGLFNGQRGGIDTNLAWLTSGEFIMSTNAVRTYGVGMMNAINSLRAPRFAVGGLNVAIPRLAGLTPSPSQSGQRTLNLTIEGRSFSGLSLPENTAQSLERFAVHSQIASTGRKQSWRR